MSTRTPSFICFTLLFAGFVAIVLPACSKKQNNHHTGKYAGREVCAVCEEITQEEFNIALAGKDKYNVYPERRKISEKAYQNAIQQIDALVKKAQKDSIDLLGSHSDTQMYSIEEDEINHNVLYYPNSKEYLVWMGIGCIWCGAAMFNQNHELDSTIITAAEHISRSMDDVFACSPCFDCDFHAEIHFFEKNDDRLRKLCRYNACSWLQGEMINYDSTMFWYKDDLYCSGYKTADYYLGWNELIENWRDTSQSPYDQTSLCTNYFRNIQRFYRIRLISPEEKTQIDKNVNTVYSHGSQELEIYDDPRWDMFVHGDLQPNVCAFICNIALISDGALSESLGGNLYRALRENKDNNYKLNKYISTLPEEEQQHILYNVMGCLSLDLWEDEANAKKYGSYDTLVRDFPIFNNSLSRQTFDEMMKMYNEE